MCHISLLAVILLLVCLPSELAAAHVSPTFDRLIMELDAIIADQSEYESRFMDTNAALTHRLSLSPDTLSRFRICETLFSRYRDYNIDTAMIVAERLVNLSTTLSEGCRLKARMYYADALNKMGRHHEAIRELTSIPHTDSVRRDSYYYYLCHTTFLSLYRNESITEDDRRYYLSKIISYKDTLVRINVPGTIGWATNYAGLLDDRGFPDSAVSVLRSFYDRKSQSLDDNALGALDFTLGKLYIETGDTITGMEFMARASIADLKEAKRVYMSLQELAMLIYRQGDVERAYRYLHKAIDDINRGKARYRIYDIAEYTPIIIAAKDMEDARHRRRIIALSVILAFLAAGWCIAYFQLHRKKHFLDENRRLLANRNTQLQLMAEDLKDSNTRLKESDHIKMEYIGLLFNICSDYIKRHEDLRRKVARKVSSRQYDDIPKLLAQTSATSDFKEFITKFDTIFLSIFPNFVSEFNKLLRPEEQIMLKDDELLTPELRIYALIRLGITENAKIADFLHYSLQTVYNYRQRMRNKTIDGGKSLSVLIREIGQK